MFSQRLSMCPSVVSEVQVPSNISVAPNLCFLCNLGLPRQVSSIRMKTCHAPNTASPQHDNYRLSPNRANGVAVFEGSSIMFNNALFQRIALVCWPFTIWNIYHENHGSFLLAGDRAGENKEPER